MNKQIKNQKGVVLAISLIMLLLVTILAVSGMRATAMEERMASNSRNSNSAFQRAETALRAGEQALQDSPTSTSKTAGLANNIGISCAVSLGSIDFANETSWNAASTACQYSNGGLDGAKHKYYIEFMFAGVAMTGNPMVPCTYRVTSRGWGNDAKSHATLQSTFKFLGCSA